MTVTAIKRFYAQAMKLSSFFLSILLSPGMLAGKGFNGDNCYLLNAVLTNDKIVRNFLIERLPDSLVTIIDTNNYFASCTAPIVRGKKAIIVNDRSKSKSKYLNIEFRAIEKKRNYTVLTLFFKPANHLFTISLGKIKGKLKVISVHSVYY